MDMTDVSRNMAFEIYKNIVSASDNESAAKTKADQASQLAAWFIEQQNESTFTSPW